MTIFRQSRKASPPSVASTAHSQWVVLACQPEAAFERRLVLLLDSDTVHSAILPGYRSGTKKDEIALFFMTPSTPADPHQSNNPMIQQSTDAAPPLRYALAVTMQSDFGFEVVFPLNGHGKAGRFSTALQLGNGDESFSQSLRHQSLSFCGTANFIVVIPCAWLITPAVTKIQ